MANLVIKFIFAIIAFSLMAWFYFQSETSGDKILALLAALGYAIMAAIDVFEYHKNSKAKKEEADFVRNRKLRTILNNFHANLVPALCELGIINERSELNYEKLFELSQDDSVAHTLKIAGYSGIIDELEDFERLYESTLQHSS